MPLSSQIRIFEVSQENYGLFTRPAGGKLSFLFFEIKDKNKFFLGTVPITNVPQNGDGNCWGPVYCDTQETCSHTICINFSVQQDTAPRLIGNLFVSLKEGGRISTDTYCINPEAVHPEIIIWPNFIPWDREGYIYLQNVRSIHLWSNNNITNNPDIDIRQNGVHRIINFPIKAISFTRNHGFIFPEYKGIPDNNIDTVLALDIGTRNTKVFYIDKGAVPPNLAPFGGPFSPNANNSVSNLLKILYPTSPSYENYFFPVQIPAQFDTAIRARGGAHDAVINGTIIPKFNPIGDIKTNLKWGDADASKNYFKMFLKHLLLIICAYFKENGRNISHILWSYPTAFSPDKLNNYRLWIQNATAGFTRNLKDVPEAICSAYSAWADNVGFINAQNTITAIVDIGGGTTDLALWKGGKIIYHTSFKAAGNIIDTFDMPTIDRVFDKLSDCAYERDRMNGNLTHCAECSPSNSGRCIKEMELRKVLERGVDKGYLFNEFANYVDDGVLFRIHTDDDLKDFRDKLNFLFSGIIYYIGIVCLKFIQADKNITRIDIYFCGNGYKLYRFVQAPPPKGLYSPLVNLLKEFFADEKNINVSIGELPDAKYSVSRGLIALSPSLVAGAIFDPPDVKPIVAEEGYGIPWDQDISDQIKISTNQMPFLTKIAKKLNFGINVPAILAQMQNEVATSGLRESLFTLELRKALGL